MIIETVRVKSDDTESGFIIINKSDFNANEHVLLEDAPSEAAPSSKKTAAK